MLSGTALSGVTDADREGSSALRRSLRGDRALVAIAILVAGILGLVLRYIARAHTTPDTAVYSLPWYLFVRDHGAGALREAFTNYTPFYSYLLLIASQFDGLAAPLTLIKAISAMFELGCALVAAEMVWHATREPIRAALAFIAVWLAPTVWFNGALWGQADAIWTFFILLCVSRFMRGRNGILPFAVAVAVKAQAVFLGPFILAMILRRKLHWAWLAAVPIVYLALAIPVLVAGRPLVSVLAVYTEQADFYHDLYKGAANIWLFAGKLPYSVGVPLGLLLAAAAGLAVAVQAARSRREGPAFVLLVACISLFLMPYLLPKMHDRFFYAFEVAILVLACLDRRYLPYAAIAQLDGVLAYLAFDLKIALGVPVAAICNGALGVFLVTELFCAERPFRVVPAAWLKFGVAVVLLPAALLLVRTGWSFAMLAYVVAATLAVATAIDLLRASFRAA